MRLPAGRHHARMRTIGAAVLAIVAAAALIQLLSPASYAVGGFEVRIAVGFIHAGTTRIEIPPVGTVAARTHPGPLSLSIRLESIDLDFLEQIVSQAAPSRGVTADVLLPLQSRVAAVLSRFAARVLVLATAGGALGLLLAGEREPRKLAGGALVGLLLASVLGGLAYATYDADAFSEPQFEGILAAAPWAISAVQEGLARIDELGARMESLASNLYRLFARIEDLGRLGRVDADRTVLIVADIHNNPVGLDFIGRLSSVFEVDMIVDAGDLTDFGTPLEAELLRGIESLGVPYVVAAGNHESPAVLEVLASLENVVLLEGETVRIAGVPVLGARDPASFDADPGLMTPEQALELRIGLEARAAEPPTPSIVVVHNPRVAQPMTGSVPVVVAGHTHRKALERIDEGVYLNPGSAGAAGVRGLQAHREVPYAAMILYLKRDAAALSGWRPLAVDAVEVFNMKGAFSLNRVLLQEAAEPAGRSS